MRSLRRAKPMSSLVGALLLLSSTAALAQPKPGGPMPPSPVVAAPVIERDTASGQTFVGTVMPLKRSSVGSAVDGRVIEYPVNEGDRVKKGQPLAQLLTETIQQQILAAEAELELRQAELTELQNGSRPEEIAQAEAQMKGAKAALDYARRRHDRNLAIFQQNRAVTEEQVQEMLSLATRAEESFHDAQAHYELVRQGPRREKIAQSKARVAEQTAIVEQLKDQFRKHTMIAPFDGYVVAEQTEVGQWVSRGDLVAEVIALDQVDVEAFVQEEHIPFVSVGNSARVEIPALHNQAFIGQVALIVPQADTRSRTFPVKVRLDNVLGKAGPLIKAGMLARVTLPTGARQNAFLVPKDAIVLGGPKPMVYVIDTAAAKPAEANGQTPAPSSTVRPVTVELGVADGQWIQIRGDVAAGQQVVVQGNERLRPGQPVVITRVLEPEEHHQANAATPTRE